MEIGSKNYVVILNYNVGEIIIHTYDEETLANYKDMYEYLNSNYDLHLKESECSYMIVQDLNIRTI